VSRYGRGSSRSFRASSPLRKSRCVPRRAPRRARPGHREPRHCAAKAFGQGVSRTVRRDLRRRGARRSRRDGGIRIRGSELDVDVTAEDDPDVGSSFEIAVRAGESPSAQAPDPTRVDDDNLSRSTLAFVSTRIGSSCAGSMRRASSISTRRLIPRQAARSRSPRCAEPSCRSATFASSFRPSRVTRQRSMGSCTASAAQRRAPARRRAGHGRVGRPHGNVRYAPGMRSRRWTYTSKRTTSWSGRFASPRRYGATSRSSTASFEARRRPSR